MPTEAKPTKVIEALLFNKKALKLDRANHTKGIEDR